MRMPFMNNLTLYNEIQTAMKRGEQLAVATVVKTIGAAPCEIGAKMLIRFDGVASGTFAGPRTDSKVIEAALSAMRNGRSSLTHIHLDADQGEAVGSCGATLEVFFEV